MLKTFEVHSKWRNIERHSKCIVTALWLHSKYSYGPLPYGIPTAFETCWSHLTENRNGKPLQILPECPECASNELECTLNASRLLPESISISKEFSWNAVRMPSESFDCRLSAQRPVMSMMIIPLPHYDFFWSRNKCVGVPPPPPPRSAGAAVARHFAPPPP